ncbi:MAG: hypothetical protein LBQ24_02360 [Candidatus Peribacteria bacterium]|nr:hypothetical protein [Candidatus Peribacteria bacterium]
MYHKTSFKYYSNSTVTNLITSKSKTIFLSNSSDNTAKTSLDMFSNLYHSGTLIIVAILSLFSVFSKTFISQRS